MESVTLGKVGFTTNFSEILVIREPVTTRNSGNPRSKKSPVGLSSDMHKTYCSINGLLLRGKGEGGGERRLVWSIYCSTNHAPLEASLSSNFQALQSGRHHPYLWRWCTETNRLILSPWWSRSCPPQYSGNDCFPSTICMTSVIATSTIKISCQQGWQVPE